MNWSLEAGRTDFRDVSTYNHAARQRRCQSWPCVETAWQPCKQPTHHVHELKGWDAWDLGGAKVFGLTTSGAYIKVDEAGYAPNGNVVIWIHSQARVIGQATADAPGKVSGVVRIPDDIPLGTHDLVVEGVDPDHHPASNSRQVQISRPGSDVALLSFGSGLLLLLAGGVSGLRR